MKALPTLISFWIAQTEDRGATMVEYALMVSLIAIVAIVGVTLFGPALSGFFSELAGNL
jgi:pilus assembly protein Flp/PilA